MTDSSDDFFASLTADIAAALSKTKLKSDAAAAKRRANNTRLPIQARAEAREAFRETEALIEADRWIPKATVALFSIQECDGCGSRHELFMQYMERQEAKTTKATRWVRTTSARTGFPREVMTQTTQTHICSYCAEEHGFDLTSTEDLHSSIPVGPSLSYRQDDINQDYPHAQS